MPKENRERSRFQCHKISFVQISNLRKLPGATITGKNSALTNCKVKEPKKQKQLCSRPMKRLRVNVPKHRQSLDVGFSNLTEKPDLHFLLYEKGLYTYTIGNNLVALDFPTSQSTYS